MSDPQKDGGPAFAADSSDKPWPSQEGMTLRDWFAGQALAGLDPFAVNPQSAAQRAYNQADAMLAERAK